MPEPLFKTVTKFDSGFGEFWLGKWIAGLNSKSDATAQLRNQVSNYKASKEETGARKERQDIDYRIIYEHFEGIDHRRLVDIYSVLNRSASTTKVVWFTSNHDAFFGPSSVSRLLQEIQAESKVEICVVQGASHANIYEIQDVWAKIGESLGLAKKSLA